MPSKSELNLVGVAWPVCLLKFKCALNDLCSYDVMDVFARDPDVVDNIIIIVKWSGNTLINQHKKGDVYRLSVGKRV